jgi:hypothetical protein
MFDTGAILSAGGGIAGFQADYDGPGDIFDVNAGYNV